MFSVTPEIAINSPLRNEPPRHSAQDNSPQDGDFAALIDSNAAAGSRSDRPAPSNSSDDSARHDDTSRSQNAAPRDGNTGTTDPAQDSSQPSGNGPRTSGAGPDRGASATSSKPAKTTAETASESPAKDDTPAADTTKTTDATATVTQIQADATAIAVAIPPAPTAPATATTPVIDPTAGGPLTIAAAAIATSAKEAAETSVPVTTPAANPAPTASASDAAAITEAVAAASNEIATTNFKIAKAVETAPTPASTLAADANADLQVQQQLGAAVVTPDAGLIKTAQKASASEHRDNTAAAVAKALKPDDAAASSQLQQANADNSKTQPPTTPDAQIDHSAASTKPDGVPAGDTPARNAGNAATEHRAANLNTPATLPTDTISQTTNTVAQPQFVPTATTAVPASQLSAAVATGIAVPLNGLAIQIAANAQSGRSRFDIRLDPAELGRIDVRLDVDRHGQVTSHLVVEKPETLAMLRQDAPQLQRALEDAGLKTGSNGLQFSLRDQSSGNNGGGDHSGRHAQRLIIGDADILPAVTAGKSYGQTSGSSRGLDIRV